MSSGPLSPAAASKLLRAAEAEHTGQLVSAELLYLQVLRECPSHVGSMERLARLAMQRGDPRRAAEFLQPVVAGDPADVAAAIDLAVALVNSDRSEDAASVLEATVAAVPAAPTAWLLLGRIRESLDDDLGALKAWYQAVTRAQRAGQWVDEATTPASLVDVVEHAIEKVHVGRRALFFGAFEGLRQQYGAAELRRVDRALTGYLRDWNATPRDPRQRPKFFYFPDLPDDPYHDPFLQPWAERLQAAFPEVRAEALNVIEQDRRLPDFIEVPEGVRPGHLAGPAVHPSWEALFFYRRGRRFDVNHERCPRTSAILESIELCRIAEQAPEILFSVLRPGTHILPHHGVSNVRLVMHLPLIVPRDCALNLVGVGEHHWQEGRLVMFDDTFSHEAWNRSDETRVVLLMDCWNPHLGAVEKLAVARLIEAISGLQDTGALE